MAVELWDLYNQNRQKVASGHHRGTSLPPDCYYLVVQAWIRSAQGGYLISRRSANRRNFPLFYETVAGAVLANETSYQAVLREVKEEIGLKLAWSTGKLLFTIKRDNPLNQSNRPANSFLDVYLFNYDGPVDLSLATTDEVDKISWLSAEEIRDLARRNLMVPDVGVIFEQVNALFPIS